jgi:hypothetical protein
LIGLGSTHYKSNGNTKKGRWEWKSQWQNYHGLSGGKTNAEGTLSGLRYHGHVLSSRDLLSFARIHLRQLVKSNQQNDITCDYIPILGLNNSQKYCWPSLATLTETKWSNSLSTNIFNASLLCSKLSVEIQNDIGMVLYDKKKKLDRLRWRSLLPLNLAPPFFKSLKLALGWTVDKKVLGSKVFEVVETAEPGEINRKVRR